MMIKLLLVIVLALSFSACTTPNKLANEAIYHAIVGENEKTVISRLGMPTNIIQQADGGKIMVYEHYTKGMFTTPYKSVITYNSSSKSLTGKSAGLAINSGVNTATNDPSYTIHETNVVSLKVFFDKQGKCIRFEQDLPKEQLGIYQQRFEKYIPKE